MSIAFWGLTAFGAAALLDWGIDHWIDPARRQANPLRRMNCRWALWFGLPVFALFMAWRNAGPGEMGSLLLLAAVLLGLATIDWEQRRVPNAIVLPAAALALVFAWANGDLPSSLAGGVVAIAIFYVVYGVGKALFSGGALGAGDVKLAGLIGTVVGVGLLPSALGLGILSAGLVAAALLTAGRARRGDFIPYGYFMALGAVAALAAEPWLAGIVEIPGMR